MDLMTHQCPDCGTEGPKAEHAPSCPLAARLEQVAAEDREWFAAQPHLDTRTRRLDWSEASLLKAAGAQQGSGWVTIEQVRPGLRVRHYDGWTAA